MDPIVINQGDQTCNGDAHSQKEFEEESSSEVDSRLWFSFRSGSPAGAGGNHQHTKTPLSSIPAVTQNTPVLIPDRTLLYYPLRPSGGHRGRALIFNWELFRAGKGPREGSKVDVQRLTFSFSKLGFAVQEPFNNLTSSEAYRQLLQESRFEGHRELDALVIILLSHGEAGDLICTSDGGTIKLEQITALFTADRCPALAGKPKLFFIQACRGTKLDPGILVTDSPSKSITSSKSGDFLLPTQADFFLFFSTVSGHYAWRNTTTGSWFIQDLCFILDAFVGSEESSGDFDLGTLATLVSQRVAFTRESWSEDARMDAKKQCPVVVSTLTRLLRFGPWRLK